MARQDTVSIQQPTKGAIAEFLEREGNESLPEIKLLCYLCGALQRYEEEGQLLEPKVLLTKSIDAFVKMVPGCRHITIGDTKFDDRCGKKILKECATLARSGWHIFCEPNGNVIKFGVFSTRESPTSLDLQEVLELEESGDEACSLLVEKVHAKEIIMRSSSGNSLKIAFSTSQEASYDIAEIDQFVAVCTRALDDEKFTKFFYRLLARRLGGCHGTILVAVKSATNLAEVGLGDGILLSEEIEIQSSFAAYDKSDSADAVLELQRIEGLLLGFLDSDGVVIFSDAGGLRGYRAFFKPPEGAFADETVEIVGGARRRAYEGLKHFVGSGIEAVLFRSQDGVIECKRVE